MQSNGWRPSENVEDLRGQPGAPDPFADYMAERYGARTVQPDEIMRRNQANGYNPQSKMLDPTLSGLERLLRQPAQQFQIGDHVDAIRKLLGFQ